MSIEWRPQPKVIEGKEDDCSVGSYPSENERI